MKNLQNLTNRYNIENRVGITDHHAPTPERMKAIRKRYQNMVENEKLVENANEPETWLHRYTRRLAAGRVDKINRTAGMALCQTDIDDIQSVMLSSFWEFCQSNGMGGSDDVRFSIRIRSMLAGDDYGKKFQLVGSHCYKGVSSYISSFRKDTGVYNHCYSLDAETGKTTDETARLADLIADKTEPSSAKNGLEKEYISNLISSLSHTQAEIVTGLAMGNMRETICEKVEISTKTYYRELARIAKIAEKLDNANVLSRYRKITKRERNNRNVQLKAYIQTVDANVTKEEKAAITEYLKAVRFELDNSTKSNKRKA